MRFLALLFFVFHVRASPARASDSFAQAFKAAGSAVPTALLNQGYKDIGNLPLSALLREIRAAKVEPIGFFRREEPNGTGVDTGRSGAEWAMGKGQAVTIRVNQPLWLKTSPRTREVLALHEFLGPAGLMLGFNDHDYRLSSALWALTRPEAEQNLTTQEKQGLANFAGKETQSHVIIGVGGGGDPAGVDDRLAALERDLRALGNAGGKARHSLLRNLYASFDLQTEVGRRATGREDARMESWPNDASGNELHLFVICRQLLAQSDSSIQFIFHWLQAKNPALTAQWGSAEGLRRFCQQKLDAQARE